MNKNKAIYEQTVVISSVKEEDMIQIAKKAICDCIYKKLMEGDLIDIQLIKKDDETTTYYGEVYMYNQKQQRVIDVAIQVAGLKNRDK